MRREYWVNIVPPRYDLIVLVADADAEQVFCAILGRPLALGIRSINFNVHREPGRDPGCRQGAAAFLRQFCGKADHAIVAFDHEGCGAESVSPVDLEAKIEAELSGNGWAPSSVAAIVIAPELEAWVWGSMPHIERVCHWTGRVERLSNWLQNQQILHPTSAKPPRPKEALQTTLRATKTPFSPALFRNLAERVSLQNRQDRAFLKLRQSLQTWFATDSQVPL